MGQNREALAGAETHRTHLWTDMSGRLFACLRAHPTVVRFAVSVTALALLTRVVDWRRLAAEWLKADTPWFLAALALFVSQAIVRLLRWHLLLLAARLPVRLSATAEAFASATFANLFLPADIGGDAVRAYKLGRTLRAQAATWASVVMDRLIGMLAMFGMAGVSLLFAHSDATSAYRLPALLLTGASVAAVAVLVSERAAVIATRLVSRISVRMAGAGDRFLSTARLCRRAWYVIPVSLLLAAVAQMICYVSWYALALALGIDCSLWHFVWFTPVIMLISMLPSANGIGVREGAFVLTLGTVGVSPEQATLLSLNVFGLTVALGLLAGLYVLVVQSAPKWRSAEKGEGDD